MERRSLAFVLLRKGFGEDAANLPDALETLFLFERFGCQDTNDTVSAVSVLGKGAFRDWGLCEARLSFKRCLLENLQQLQQSGVPCYQDALAYLTVLERLEAYMSRGMRFPTVREFWEHVYVLVQRILETILALAGMESHS